METGKNSPVRVFLSDDGRISDGLLRHVCEFKVFLTSGKIKDNLSFLY